MSDLLVSGQQAHLIWLSSGGCDGCTMSVLGASTPTFEEFLGGSFPGVPELVLVHTTLAFDAGASYLEYLNRAWRGEIDPYVLIVEGSIFDESRAGKGHFATLGEVDGQAITVAEWLQRLAPGAAAVVAIGSCATWGGIPAASGSVTGAMGVTDFFGRDFCSAGGLPIINVPGCAPQGDAFLELVAHIFLNLSGLVPLELDAENRPRWLYHPTTFPRPARAAYLPPAAYAPDSRPHIGCPVPSRGWMNRIGGCGTVGGRCIACTMPSFADVYLPLSRVELQNHSDSET